MSETDVCNTESVRPRLFELEAYFTADQTYQPSHLGYLNVCPHWRICLIMHGDSDHVDSNMRSDICI